MINKIHNIDCVDGMRMLPDNSVDLTVTSPPYDNLRKYMGYIWDFESTAKELYRVTKPGGVVVWIVGDETIKGSETGTSFKQALFFKECGFYLHDTMIYQKLNPMPRDTRIPRYWQAFEYMFVFSKGKPQHFNWILENTKTSGEMRGACGSRKTDGDMRTDRRKKTAGHRVGKTKPRINIWAYGRDKIKSDHPATFPENLAQDHILSWSNPGDVVMDPFMGSGTTAKMALLNNRNFIGFEISEDYCKIANARIRDAQIQSAQIKMQEV